MATIITVWVDDEGDVHVTLDERVAIAADAADRYGGASGKAMAVSLLSIAVGALEAERDRLIEAIAEAEDATGEKDR